MTGIIMLTAALGGFYALDSRIIEVETRVSQIERRAEEDRAVTVENTRAVRSLEMSAAAIGERLKNIERSSQATEAMLREMLREQRRDQRMMDQ
jgi:uncharacterized coiled-coil protein SlyX